MQNFTTRETETPGQPRAGVTRATTSGALRRVRTLAVATLAAVGLVACNSAENGAVEGANGDADGELTTIQVGVVPTSSFAPLYVALEEGYFADEGLDVEVQQVDNAAAITPSLLNREFQFGAVATSPFLAAIGENLPMTAVASSAKAHAPDDDDTALVVSSDSDIETPSDLADATIAVNAIAALPHIAALEVIERDGGDPSAANFVSMPFPEVNAALSQGRIDAAAIPEPFNSQTQEAGHRVISPLYSEAFSEGDVTTMYMAEQSYVEENPEIAASFRDAIDQASEQSAEDEQTVRQSLIDHGNMDEDVAESILLPSYGPGLSGDSFTEMSEIMVNHGHLGEPIDGSTVIFDVD